MIGSEEAIRRLLVHSSTNGSGLCTDEQHYEAKQMAIKALEQEPCIQEKQANADKIDAVYIDGFKAGYSQARFDLEQEPSKDLSSINPTKTGWIPVSERLPEELETVNVTWINHNPESYYADIKDKPFTATGVYFNGQWYWWSTLCTDILAEYSHNYDDIIDDDIEITAWMPLPKPYEPQERSDKE